MFIDNFIRMKYTDLPCMLVAFLGVIIGLYACSSSNPPAATESDPPADTTHTEGEAPKVETLEITNVTTSTAEGEGSVLESGSSRITERGLCWDTESDPAKDAECAGASSIQASGEFSVSLANLNDNTTYYARAYAANAVGLNYGNEITFTTQKKPEPVVYLDSITFRDSQTFAEYWNMFYPWGTDHNGSARMYEEQVSLEGDGALLIEADRTEEWEGESSADPHLRIYYHSGAIHYKEHITVSDSLPKWEISGDFQVPTTRGSWPAFWITGAWDWPPEIDIMEFKGDNVNWQNTVTGPDWQNTSWQTEKTEVQNAGNWHNYKMIMEKTDDTYVDIKLYIDGEHTATHTADFVGDPFWLIINLQMEGSSGDPGPEYAEYRARNIYLAAYPD